MKKFNITIGIPAFNEEATIQKLLNSIFAQKMVNYSLLEVIVVSDGSTDQTVQKVKEIKNKKIMVINGTKRLGKTSRLNQIFNKARGEVIVLLDADIELGSQLTINRLIKPFLNNNKIGLVGGFMMPYPAETFIEKSVNVSRDTFDQIRRHLNNGNSIYATTGCIYALSKQFANQITFPKNIWADNAYLYFACIKSGYQFKSVKNAVVKFKSPNNIKDYLSQISRYVSESETLRNEFGLLLDKGYYIPKRMIYKYKLLSFIHYPLHCLAIGSINLYAKYNVRNRISTAQWKISTSTKGEKYATN